MNYTVIKNQFYFLILIISLLLNSCRNSENKEAQVILVKENVSNSCFSKTERELVVSAIINVDYITKNHMDPQVRKGKMAAKILTNAFVTENLKIEIAQRQVTLVDSMNLTEDTYRIKILKKNCTQKEILFLVTNPYDGHWFAEGNVKRKGNLWVADVTSGGIAD